MSKYAYRDEMRTDEIPAKDAQKTDRNTRFYCPNPKCDAHLYIASVNGSVSAYFTANDEKHPHIDGCDFYEKNTNFIPSRFKEEEFDFEAALMQLTIPKKSTSKESLGKVTLGTSSLKPPHTIRQIYSMCKAYSYKDKYNKIRIGEILLDHRSFDMYKKGVFGWHLIEGYCKPYYYNDKTEPKEMYLMLSKYDLTYSSILRYADLNLFKEISQMLYNNRDKKIVVSAKWERAKDYNSFAGKITSKQQILVVK